MLGFRSPASWSVLHHIAAPTLALTMLAGATPAVPTDGAEVDATAPVVAVGEVARLEAAAIEVAHDLRAVPADSSDELCSRDDLRVSWEAPEGYTHGAHLEPVGPRPDARTAAANGVVVCGDATWAYLGFEAVREAGGWTVTPVPYVDESHEHGEIHNLDADPDAHDAHGAHDHEGGEHGGHGDPVATSGATPPVPSPSAPTRTVSTADWLGGLGPIEPYASHEPQTTCSPTAKPGTVVLRDSLLGVHPVTRNLGIVRACHLGGRSEHKEGRAFDWGAYVHRPLERAAVERFLAQLLATDADGNRHALARRMGVMYVIWNGSIWSASRAGEGWRRYSGPSPHTDHVHISLNWAGARGQTSFFTQNLAAAGVLGLVPPGATVPTSDTGGTSAPATPIGGTSSPSEKTSSPAPAKGSDGSTDSSRTSPPTSPAPPPPSSPSPSPTRDADRRAEEQRKAEEDAARRAEEERRRRAAEEAERKAAEEQRKAAEAQRKAEQEARKAEDAARRQAEQEAREASGPGKGGEGGNGGNGGNGGKGGTGGTGGGKGGKG